MQTALHVQWSEWSYSFLHIIVVFDIIRHVLYNTVQGQLTGAKPLGMWSLHSGAEFILQGKVHCIGVCTLAIRHKKRQWCREKAQQIFTCLACLSDLPGPDRSESLFIHFGVLLGLLTAACSIYQDSQSRDASIAWHTKLLTFILLLEPAGQLNSNTRTCRCLHAPHAYHMHMYLHLQAYV